MQIRFFFKPNPARFSFFTNMLDISFINLHILTYAHIYGLYMHICCICIHISTHIHIHTYTIITTNQTNTKDQPNKEIDTNIPGCHCVKLGCIAPCCISVFLVPGIPFILKGAALQHNDILNQVPMTVTLISPQEDQIYYLNYHEVIGTQLLPSHHVSCSVNMNC